MLNYFSADSYCGGCLPVFLPIGHDGYRDGQPMHDGSSPAGRERSSSLQGMDMASLPPRKRPWQDGPGTGDPRERESPGADGGENYTRVKQLISNNIHTYFTMKHLVVCWYSWSPEEDL